MNNNLLFIGNGFDLALKLKTAYRDFVNSSFWPLADNKLPSHSDGSLEWNICSFTQRVRDSETGLVRWIDLEGIMHEYAQRLKKTNIYPDAEETLALAEKNKKLLELLKYSFSQYIRSNVKVLIEPKLRGVNEGLVKVMNGILEMDCFTKVYSFNYTDTASILKNIFGWENPNVTHMHGRVTDNSSNIILGVNDRTVVEKSHRFLLKSHQEGFVSNNLFNDLQVAQTIIFYGMSFGANDMDYFKDYFRALIKGQIQRRQKVNICIFTLNGESIASIKSFFEDADVSVRDLYLNTNLYFFKTSYFGDGASGDTELNSFLKFSMENKPISMESCIM